MGSAYFSYDCRPCGGHPLHQPAGRRDPSPARRRRAVGRVDRQPHPAPAAHPHPPGCLPPRRCADHVDHPAATCHPLLAPGGDRRRYPPAAARGRHRPPHRHPGAHRCGVGGPGPRHHRRPDAAPPRGRGPLRVRRGGGPGRAHPQPGRHRRPHLRRGAPRRARSAGHGRPAASWATASPASASRACWRWRSRVSSSAARSPARSSSTRSCFRTGSASASTVPGPVPSSPSRPTVDAGTPPGGTSSGTWHASAPSPPPAGSTTATAGTTSTAGRRPSWRRSPPWRPGPWPPRRLSVPQCGARLIRQRTGGG